MNQVMLDRLASRGPLADWEIYQICQPPCGFFQYAVPVTSVTGSLLIETVEEPCWLSGAAREKRRTQLQTRNAFSISNETTAVTWRDFDPTKDEFRPMIEPFIPQQVRQRGGQLIDPPENEPPREPFDYEMRSYRAPIERVISYGLSSFGYDVRVADEFKVFTNINSTIVDPKNFDENNFVGVKGKGYCIIPPNSFALGRTMERFRIPRDILTVCLGKSTYARCFTGDTKVALVDGTSASFEELVERTAKGERFWGYSVSKADRIEVAELTAPRKVGHERVLAVELDNGQVIRCTPDHKFLMRDGTYVEAQDLAEGVSLMPLYRGEYRGYESVYQPTFGRMVSTHWLSDLWNIRHGAYQEEKGTHRHHVDRDRRNNKPTNLVRMSGDEHHALHESEKWATEEARAAHGEAISEALKRLAEDKEWYHLFSMQQRLRAKRFWNDPEYAERRARLLADRQNTSEETRAKLSDATRRRFQDPTVRDLHSVVMQEAWKDDTERREKQREVARKINIREEITAAVVDAALKVAGTIRGAARYLKCDRSVFRRFPEVLSQHFGTPVAVNHKVVSIKEVEGTHDVYCLTVPEYGNFALEDGVFVKNCGIIVNVTPFEPEWEGYVTLEFSNTTPLPAKIYAEEGVAQVVFLRGNECQTSYADRNGKYMNQPAEVVTPRT